MNIRHDPEQRPRSFRSWPVLATATALPDLLSLEVSALGGAEQRELARALLRIGDAAAQPRLIELLHSGGSIASVRAAPSGPVELSLLPKDGFRNLLRGSPSTGEMVTQVARMRLAENQAQNGDCES